MKLAFFEVEDWQEKYLKEKLKNKNYSVKFFEEDISLKRVKKIKDIDGLGIFIYSQITKEILDELPKLKFIVTMSTGYEHIDINECKKRGIKVCNVPYYGENTVAEHTIGLMLSLSKKIPPSIDRVKKGNFDIEGLEGFDLNGKTLGIIGCGHIGMHVLKIAQAIGMKALVHTRTCDMKIARKHNFRYVSLNELFSSSDVISFHVPLNPATKHMLNMKNIGKIKNGAYVINTSRGGLIETNALIYGLDKGIISGVALDVLEDEENLKEERHLSKKHYSFRERRMLRSNHKLLKSRDVLITPHTAFFTREARQRILDTTINNIRNNGRKNKVN